MNRSFYVDTPIGKLKVWAKHDVDCPDDYPGVYIDFIPAGKENDCADENMVCVVEYESIRGHIQTVVYQPDQDEPVSVIRRKENNYG